MRNRFLEIETQTLSQLKQFAQGTRNLVLDGVKKPYKVWRHPFPTGEGSWHYWSHSRHRANASPCRHVPRRCAHAMCHTTASLWCDRCNLCEIRLVNGQTIDLCPICGTAVTSINLMAVTAGFVSKALSGPFSGDE